MAPPFPTPKTLDGKAVQPRPDSLLDLLLKGVPRERLAVFTNGTPDELLALVLLAVEMHSFNHVDVIVSGLCDCYFPHALAAVRLAAIQYCKLPASKLRIFAGLTKLCQANGECARHFDRYAGATPRAVRESDLHAELNADPDTAYSAAIILGDVDAAQRMAAATARCTPSRIYKSVFENTVVIIMYTAPTVACSPAPWTRGRKCIYTFSAAHAVGDLECPDRLEEIARRVRTTYPSLWPDVASWPKYGLCQANHEEYYPAGVCMLVATLNMPHSQVPEHLAKCFGHPASYYFTYTPRDVHDQADSLWTLMNAIDDAIGTLVTVWRE